ncbi:heat shock 70 kDa protein 12A-like [Planococcus citri]|uniref:heat shock 70 kDa protein 12A-like n=1 Tax=Planococcus citri TaxID=170843 RepID=UPI0031F7E2CD
MRYRVREKDSRRIGYVFEDDPLQDTPTDMTAVENWKSVMTELNEKKIKHKELSTSKKTIDSSFDSGIQQEYNSDSDEVCNSICMTLNKLVELSKEQEIYLRNSPDIHHGVSENNPATVPSYDQNKYPDNILYKNIDSLSIQSSSSETNNLVEEMIMKNSCAKDNATEIAVPATALGRYTDNSSARINAYKHLSRSAQNLNTDTVADPNGDSFQSLPFKRNYIKNTIKSKNIVPQSNKNDSEVVIAIDIGTTFSGFSFAIEDSPSSSVNIMKSIKDPSMRKLPSILLLNSRTEFHSFGYDAKDYFLSIEQRTSSLSTQWLLFEKFKLQLLNFIDIDRECEIKATNGICVPALTVYTRTLNYFKCLALLEVSNVLQKPIKKDQIRWVITIPVMWSVKGKLFMQEAAFNAGLCTLETKERLRIIYEPEAVASWCNLLGWSKITADHGQSNSSSENYVMLVNCGGGLVDVTIHQTNDKYISIITEIHKASETIYSSHYINEEFLQLMILIFGNKFVNSLKSEKPASLIDLLYHFEFCKCFLSKSTHNSSSANLFVGRYIADFYKKITGKQMSETVVNFSHEDVTWSEQGAICINANLLQRLFQPLTQKIIKLIKQILQNRSDAKPISRIYFAGGLTKSHIFQESLKDGLEDSVSLIFLQESELCVLKGAVQRSIADTSKCYKMTHSYAVGVMKQFQKDIHPLEKMVSKDGRKWCCDLLDWLIKKDQILQKGEVILKRYTPTASQQSCIIINVYIVENNDSRFVTDNGVHNCGALRLTTSPSNATNQHEILLQLIYNGKEFIANALDTMTARCTQTKLDNLSYL